MRTSSPPGLRRRPPGQVLIAALAYKRAYIVIHRSHGSHRSQEVAWSAPAHMCARQRLQEVELQMEAPGAITVHLAVLVVLVPGRPAQRMPVCQLSALTLPRPARAFISFSRFTESSSSHPNRGVQCYPLCGLSLGPQLVGTRTDIASGALSVLSQSHIVPGPRIAVAGRRRRWRLQRASSATR